MLTNSPDLVQASYEGDLARVRALLSSGVDVNSQNEHGMGALLTFVPSLTEYLLSEGADPDVQTNEYEASVLAGLCYVTKVECVRILLEHGADPNQGRDETLETPLHHCLGGAHNPLETQADGDVEQVGRMA
jgi:ankyrin repeat protein